MRGLKHKDERRRLITCGAIRPPCAAGAVDETDARPWFSNYGACTDIFAPGANVRAAAWSGGAAAAAEVEEEDGEAGEAEDVGEAAGAEGSSGQTRTPSDAAAHSESSSTMARAAAGGDGAGFESASGGGRTTTTISNMTMTTAMSGEEYDVVEISGDDDDGEEEEDTSVVGGAAWRRDVMSYATRLGHGTSVAAPFVAGAAAVFLSHVPRASADDVYAALTAGATRDKVGDPGDGSPNLLLNVRGVEVQAKECRRNQAAAAAFATAAAESTTAASAAAVAAAVAIARKTCVFGPWTTSCPVPEARCVGATTRRERRVSVAPPCGSALCAMMLSREASMTEEVTCPCGVPPPPPPPLGPPPPLPPPPPHAPMKLRGPANVLGFLHLPGAAREEEHAEEEEEEEEEGEVPRVMATAGGGESFHRFGVVRAFEGTF